MTRLEASRIQVFSIVLLVIGASITPSVTGYENTPSASITSSGAISSSGEMASSISPSSFKIGTYELSWNFNEENVSTIADTFNMSQSWWISPGPNDVGNFYNSKMAQVLNVNPAYKFLVYRNIAVIYNYWPDEWNYAKSQGWLLKDADGNYVTSSSAPTDYFVDITNASYQQWVGSEVAGWIQQNPQFAGVFVDNCIKYSVQDWMGYADSTPINPATGQPFTTQQILNGCVGTINSIIAAVGNSKIVIANGLWSGFLFDLNTSTTSAQNLRYILSRTPGLTGIMSEGPFYQSYTTNFYSVAQWQESVNMVQWVQSNFLAADPNNRYVALVPVECAPIPAGITKLNLAMFGFCSLLLGVTQSNQNFIGFGGSPSTMSEDSQMMAFAEQIKNLNLGTPLDSYYQVNSESLFARDFTYGHVLVNPSSESISYTLDQNYTFLNGTAAPQSLIIGPHQGVILLNE